MTKRDYYSDSYITEFEAKVTEQTEFDGRPAVVLDATFFYPTGGGQPNDLGTLNGIAVLDVVTRADDEAVLHVMESPLEAQSVKGVIDRERRFDFMQHHSGQHILSRAFEDLYDAQTIGFHLSDNSVTIDVDKPNLSVEQLEAAERLSNQIILENRPVRAWFPDEGELNDLALRKISEKVSGAVRVVDMGGFDACACGGTHVANTGEIGVLKIIRTEGGKKHTRIEFCCGWRVLADYHQKNGLLLQIANDMSMSYEDVPEAIVRLQNENKSLGKALKTARGRLLQYEAEELWQDARDADPEAERVVLCILWEDREAADLNSLMPHLIKKPATVALMGIPGEKAHLIFGCSEDLSYDVVPLLRAALDTLGTKSGGGRPTLAQGGGFKASRAQMESVMDYARERAYRGE